MAVRSTPAQRPAAGDSVDSFYPLTREQLLVPAIPRIRLSLAASAASPAAAPSSTDPSFTAPSSTDPKGSASPRHSAENTLAARSRADQTPGRLTPQSQRQSSFGGRPNPSAAAPNASNWISGEPHPNQRLDAGHLGRDGIGHLVPPPAANAPTGPDVCFAARVTTQPSPSLAEMAAVAFPPGQIPWESHSVGPRSRPQDGAAALSSGGVDLATSLAAATRRSRTTSASYPYWLVALIQIFIGTMLVIMVVKFANTQRESAANTAPTTTRGAATTTTSHVPGQSDESAGLRITWFGRQASADHGSNAGIFEF